MPTTEQDSLDRADMERLVAGHDAALNELMNRHAGAVFFGRWNAVPFGDYGVGSNHVLPTMGTARFSAGLRAADFVKVFPVTWMDRDAARALAPAAAALARSEGLDGHALEQVVVPAPARDAVDIAEGALVRQRHQLAPG